MKSFIARVSVAVSVAGLAGCLGAPAEETGTMSAEDALVLVAKPAPPPRYLVRSARGACEMPPRSAWRVEPVDAALGEDFCRYIWQGEGAADVSSLHPYAKTDAATNARYVVRERAGAPAVWPVVNAVPKVKVDPGVLAGPGTLRAATSPVAAHAPRSLGITTKDDPQPRVNGCEACQLFSMNGVYFVVLPYEIYGGQITLSDGQSTWQMANEPGSQAFHVQLPGPVAGAPSLSWNP